MAMCDCSMRPTCVGCVLYVTCWLWLAAVPVLYSCHKVAMAGDVRAHGAVRGSVAAQTVVEHDHGEGLCGALAALQHGGLPQHRHVHITCTQ